MKKITILTLIFTLGLVSFNTVFAAIAPETGVENTLALCTNGEDDNGNGAVDFQDADCSTFNLVTPVFVENTLALCTDGEDNNGNGAVDFQDVNCAAFVPVPVFVENTLALCTDGEDNNGNGAVDFQDVNCAAFAPAAATTTATTTPVVTTGGTVGSSFGGGSSSGSSFGSGITSGTPISTVISTSTGTTTCADMFKTYMKKGQKNDVNEVKKLQKLLGVKVTGFFGNLTFNAVKAFQLKYTDSVLTPWGINHATGYFYKTTQRQANLLMCSTANIPMPVLN